MKYLNLFILLILASSANLKGQEVEVIKFPQLQEIIDTQGDKVKLINFWATWCKPCIEELPYFAEAEKKYGKDAIEIILVSFDFSADQVNKYVKKHEMVGKLYLLDETDFDTIINKIDKKWQGGIPATLVIDQPSNTKTLYEKQFAAGELDAIINKLVK